MQIENHETFLQRVRGKFSERDFVLMDFAYDLTKKGHHEQERESGGRYFEHPRHVVLILMDKLGIFDYDMIIAGLFHDLKEDAYILKDRRIEYVFNAEIQRIVDLVTKPDKSDDRFKTKDEKLDWYFEQIMKSDWKAKTIKLADRLHNLRTLSACTKEKYDKQIAETKKYFVPMIEDLRNERPMFARFFRKEFRKFIGEWA
jgi:GTP pyrophosphokinase